MQNQQAKRASIYLGVFMAVVLLGGTILQVIGGNTTTTQQTIDPTATPAPTLPPPITDFSNITFDSVYLHPSGLYTVGQPPGWEASQPSQNNSQAQVNFVNSTALSVIDVYVERGFAAITPEELSARFTEAVLDASWANFNEWRETNRRIEGERLLIDFVVRFQGQDYIARQIVTSDGEWIYVTRVLAPHNASGLVSYLMDNLPGTFTPFKVFKDTPFSWTSYYDPTFSHIIRFPQEWGIEDSAPGRLTSIRSANGVSLRVQGFANTSVADQAAAEAWLQAVRPGATILSVEPTTRDGVSGFSVAYAFSNADGEPQSGLAVLLNGTVNGEPVLHTANLYFAAANVDLNAVETLQEQAAAIAAGEVEVTPEATGEVADAFAAASEVVGGTGETAATSATVFTELASVMETFRVLPLTNLSADSLPPATPTPLAPVVPPEATTEATAEVTAAADAQAAAPEATGEATAEATAEATTAP